MPNFAQFLKQKRESLGLNQSELATLAECSNKTISNIETEHFHASPAIIVKLARVLDFDPRPFTNPPTPEEPKPNKVLYEVPAYVRNGWSGAEVSLVYEETLGNVIRLEFSADGSVFYPIPLQGRMKVFVGKDLPDWGASMIFYDNVKSWRYTQYDGKQAVHDIQGLGFYLAIAPVEKKK